MIDKQMIPKIIHYVWFGRGAKSELFKKCYASWVKYMPGYKIIEWNEDNFDINIVPYVKQSYEKKKYAFASDYARFWILYHYGGLYLDTDVELIRPLDDIIDRGNFMGCEQSFAINPGIGMAVNPGLDIFKKILDHYNQLSFDGTNGIFMPKTIVEYTTEIFKSSGYVESNEIQEVAGIWVYPPDYFCPYSIESMKMRITVNTHSIHWYDASWYSNNPIIKQIQLWLCRFKIKLHKIMDDMFGYGTYNKLKNMIRLRKTNKINKKNVEE